MTTRRREGNPVQDRARLAIPAGGLFGLIAGLVEGVATILHRGVGADGGVFILRSAAYSTLFGIFVGAALAMAPSAGRIFRRQASPSPGRSFVAAIVAVNLAWIVALQLLGGAVAVSLAVVIAVAASAVGLASLLGRRLAQRGSGMAMLLVLGFLVATSPLIFRDFAGGSVVAATGDTETRNEEETGRNRLLTRLETVAGAILGLGRAPEPDRTSRNREEDGNG